MYIRSNLRFLMKQRGMNCTMIEEMIGLSKGSINFYLNYGIREENLKIFRLNILAKFLNVKIDDLVNKDLSQSEKKEG